MRRLYPVLALVSLLALAPVAPLAGPARAASVEVAQADVVPLPRVLNSIERRYPGRALDAQLRDRGDDPIYWIKWLARDGKVWEIVVDARTGEILSAR